MKFSMRWRSTTADPRAAAGCLGPQSNRSLIKHGENQSMVVAYHGKWENEYPMFDVENCQTANSNAICWDQNDGGNMM